ncbi:SRPBCC family protein [Mycobacterium sp. NPDC050853]|uniref:SRPBCC family protein n=1 Tax=Mycobacteriaceae TaxID=1762 RepID=UPI0015DF7312|nr:SRPBCC family protein [Mycobacteroides sp. LB1]
MTHIHHRSTAKVPMAYAFDYISDAHHLADWMFGIEHVRFVNEVERGPGARYDVAINLGATLRSTIEVVGWEPDTLFTTESRSGIDNQIECRFQPVSADETELEINIDYRLPGGLAGRALGKVISPFISLAITHSDEKLRKILEEGYRREVTSR